MKKDPLFELIKSLKKTEKSYFKKFCQLHTIGESNNYVTLFNVLNSMESYDEDYILGYFEGETFTKQLHVTKNYLYKQILKCLRVYHTSDNIDSQIRELIDYTNILYQKGFLTQAIKQLHKAKNIAIKCHKNEYLLVIIRWEIRIISSELYAGKTAKLTDELVEDISSTLKIIHTENDLFLLTTKLFENIRTQGHVRDQQELKQLDSLLKNPILSPDNKLTSFRSKLYYHYILSIVYTEKNNTKLAIESANQLLKVISNYPDQKNDEKGNFIAVLNHGLEIIIHFNEFSEARKYFSILDSLLLSYFDNNANLFIRSYILKLQWDLKQGRFQSKNDSILRIESMITNDHDKINGELLFKAYFSLAHYYFGLKAYNKSLKWVNLILNSKNKNRKDIKSLASLLFLIIHYEMENFDILKYYIKSTHSTLLKDNMLFKIEIIIISTLKKAINSKSLDKTAKLFKELKSKLEIILKNEKLILETNAFSFLIFMRGPVRK